MMGKKVLIVASPEERTHMRAAVAEGLKDHNVQVVTVDGLEKMVNESTNLEDHIAKGATYPITSQHLPPMVTNYGYIPKSGQEKRRERRKNKRKHG